MEEDRYLTPWPVERRKSETHVRSDESERIWKSSKLVLRDKIVMTDIQKRMRRAEDHPIEMNEEKRESPEQAGPIHRRVAKSCVFIQRIGYESD